MSRPALAGAPRRLKGRMTIGGQEHFYLESQVALAIPGEDDEVTVHASTQHPSEIQHMVAPRARRALQRRDGDRAPHGRRLRRQGDAGQPVRRGRGAGGQEARPGGQDPARPRRRHDDHRQAPRFRRRLRGRLRRRRPHPGGRRQVHGAGRLFGRPLRAGDRPGAVSRRQRLLLSRRAARKLLPLVHQHRLQHRLSRLRRPAGHGGRRALDRGDRLCPGQGPARDPQGQFLRHRHRQRDALPPDGGGQHHPSRRRGTGSALRTTRRGGRRSSPSTRNSPILKRASP